MAAPKFVPTAPDQGQKAYVSPPRRAGGWTATRPGDVVDQGQPRGVALGNQGPDQGFALKLARAEADKMHLAVHEHRDDVVVGVVGVATRRASLFARAPMIHDVRLALEVFGFTDPSPDAHLVEWRRSAFAGLSHTATHYLEARRLAAGVPEHILLGTPAQAAEARRSDWKAVVGAHP